RREERERAVVARDRRALAHPERRTADQDREEREQRRRLPAEPPAQRLEPAPDARLRGPERQADERSDLLMRQAGAEREAARAPLRRRRRAKGRAQARPPMRAPHRLRRPGIVGREIRDLVALAAVSRLRSAPAAPELVRDPVARRLEEPGA